MKKKSKKLKRSASKKVLETVQEPVQTQVPAEAKKPGKKIFAIIFAVALAIIIAEIVIIAMKQKRLNQRPVLVSTWNLQYKGQSGKPVSGSHMYIIDTGANQVKKYEKISGALKEVFMFDSVPAWAQEDSAGNVFVLLRGPDRIVKMQSKDKFEQFMSFENGGINNFIINSNGEFAVSDGKTGQITIYNAQAEKVNQFGGMGTGKGNFVRLGRVFIDHKDYYYAFDATDTLKVKIFSNKGKFVKEFKVQTKMHNPMDALAITNDGNIYYNDWNDSVVKVFDNNGKYQGQFNTDKDMKYKIGAPGALSGGPDNLVYVGSYNVAVFEPIKY